VISQFKAKIVPGEKCREKRLFSSGFRLRSVDGRNDVVSLHGTLVDVASGSCTEMLHFHSHVEP